MGLSCSKIKAELGRELDPTLQGNLGIPRAPRTTTTCLLLCKRTMLLPSLRAAAGLHQRSRLRTVETAHRCFVSFPVCPPESFTLGSPRQSSGARTVPKKAHVPPEPTQGSATPKIHRTRPPSQVPIFAPDSQLFRQFLLPGNSASPGKALVSPAMTARPPTVGPLHPPCAKATLLQNVHRHSTDT